jgi:hypothetical protein
MIEVNKSQPIDTCSTVQVNKKINQTIQAAQIRIKKQIISTTNPVQSTQQKDNRTNPINSMPVLQFRVSSPLDPLATFGTDSAKSRSPTCTAEDQTSRFPRRGSLVLRKCVHKLIHNDTKYLILNSGHCCSLISYH